MRVCAWGRAGALLALALVVAAALVWSLYEMLSFLASLLIWLIVAVALGAVYEPTGIGT